MEYNTREEINSAIESGKAVVVFSAEWCGPCKSYAPIVDELKKDSETPVVRVNVDEEGELARKYGVRGIPTTLVLVNGEVDKTLVGLQDKQTFASLL